MVRMVQRLMEGIKRENAHRKKGVLVSRIGKKEEKKENEEE